MDSILTSDNNGDVIDVIFILNPKARKLSYKRIRCFCYIELIHDYAFVFVPRLKFLRRKKGLSK